MACSHWTVVDVAFYVHFLWESSFFMSDENFSTCEHGLSINDVIIWLLIMTFLAYLIIQNNFINIIGSQNDFVSQQNVIRKRKKHSIFSST
jgi:hypothetical protein